MNRGEIRPSLLETAHQMNKKAQMNNKTSALLTILAALGLIAASSSHAMAATDTPSQELAAVTPIFLQLEITSVCTDKGSIFKIINRGKKWLRQGILHVYYSDDRAVMTERRLRLAPNQKVSFVINKEKSSGRPIGMWIEPGWYKREFTYDAKSAC